MEPLRILDALRKHFGKSIVILSSYHSPAYNAAISETPDKSRHLKFNALDIALSGPTPC